ncbi:MAG: hypothetical protein ACK55I_11440, partial [bacterium]
HAKTSCTSKIRMLEDQEIREKEGPEMQILALATQKHKNNLENYHSYADNTVDKPFLTPDSVEEEN